MVKKITTYYDKQNKKEKECYYVDHLGRKQGLEITHWENGKLSSQSTYKNGQKDGLCATYHRNGTLASMGEYQNGVKEGRFRICSSKGKIIKIEIYLHNQLMHTRPFNGYTLFTPYAHMNDRQHD